MLSISNSLLLCLGSLAVWSPSIRAQAQAAQVRPQRAQDSFKWKWAESDPNFAGSAVISWNRNGHCVHKGEQYIPTQDNSPIDVTLLPSDKNGPADRIDPSSRFQHPNAVANKDGSGGCLAAQIVSFDVLKAGQIGGPGGEQIPTLNFAIGVCVDPKCPPGSLEVGFVAGPPGSVAWYNGKYIHQ